MTRINTNVSSLIAQKTLARSNSQLQESLTRLSTGLRINVGKDDPAGLIASEALRSDIISVEKAIVNSERANQLIATADSALGQVSSLLNDIRGLVSEAANVGALSPEQIGANQLQVDSSLEAIDRIAQITTFQGNRLLDGSLDFITTNVDSTTVQGLRIDQANFGTQTQIGVDIAVAAQATKAELNYGFDGISEDVVLQVGGANGTEAFSFASGSTIQEISTAVNLVSDATGVSAEVQTSATAGSLSISGIGENNDIVITADQPGQSAGDVQVKYSEGAVGSTTVAFTAASGDDPATLNVQLEVSDYTAAKILVDNTGGDNAFTVEAKQKGSDFDGIQVAITTNNGGAPATATYDHSTKTITIDIDNTDGLDDLLGDITTSAANREVDSLFTFANAEAVGGGLGVVAAAADVAAGAADTVVTAGTDGGTVIATSQDIVDAINNDAGASAVLTAALGEGNDGKTTNLAAFSEFAYFGDASANTRLQFLAPADAANISFVVEAGISEITLDTTTTPIAEDFARATVQEAAANASYAIVAKTKGSEFDGVTVKVTDSGDVTQAGDEFVTYDRESKTIEIFIDDTVSTATDLVAAVNNDSYVSTLFRGEVFGGGAGTGVVTTSAAAGTTSGGQTDAGTLQIKLATDANGAVTTTANDLVEFFDSREQALADGDITQADFDLISKYGISAANIDGSNGLGVLSATTEDITFETNGLTFTDDKPTGTTTAANGTNARVTFEAKEKGSEFGDIEVTFVNSGSVTAAGSELATFNAAAKTLEIDIHTATDAADIEALFHDTTGQTNVKDLFTVTAGGTGAGVITTADTTTLSSGVTATGTSTGAALLGNEDAAATSLKFISTEFGSSQFVEVKALSGSFGLTNNNGASADRQQGVDIDARINGIQAIGNGRQASINTASLDLSFSIAADADISSSINFQITGGGALFQLGPDVVSNQQARLGIQSVSTATLGGVNGRLFELRSGGDKSLNTDAGGAAKIVDEVITSVTRLRGRLGAFQKTTLETNIFTLNDTLANITEAESSIRDADFAAESAKLTRSQILVQSGISVLSIANQNPQNVLALLR